MTHGEKPDDADAEVMDSTPAARDSSEEAGDASIDDRHEISYSDELKRKAVHLVALIIPLAIWMLGRTPAVMLLAALSATALAADLLRIRSQAFARFLYRFVGFMMRPEECPAVGGPLVLNGATWVLLSATLLLIFFPVEITILSFTAFMLADATAAIVGRRWGRHRWKGTSRTVEGSTAFLAVSVLVMLAFGWIPVVVIVLASLAGTAAEIPSRPLNDNIRVPLVMGAVIYLVGTLTG